MPTVALLAARPDLARALARTVERTHPDYDVDVYTAPQSAASRVVALLRGDYDLVQVDETMRNGVLGALLADFGGTPLVVCVRGWADYTNDHGQHSLARHASIAARSRYVFDRAADVLFVSELCRVMVRREYVTPEGRVVGRPFEVAQYLDLPRRTSPEETRILTVTNLRYDEKARGVEIAVEGLEPLFEAYPDLRYQVAGSGRALAGLRESIADSPYRDRIDLLGYREDVPDLLSRADLFCYVSFLDSLAMTVLEAQAAGVPVVASGATGVPEAVGTAGVICAPTAEGVTDAVGGLLADPERREALSAAGREKLRRHNARAADEFVAAWDDAIGR